MFTKLKSMFTKEDSHSKEEFDLSDIDELAAQQKIREVMDKIMEIQTLMHIQGKSLGELNPALFSDLVKSIITIPDSSFDIIYQKLRYKIRSSQPSERSRGYETISNLLLSLNILFHVNEDGKIDIDLKEDNDEQ